MRLPLYTVDAFTFENQPFTGNAAAVCILQYDVSYCLKIQIKYILKIFFNVFLIFTQLF